MLVRAPVAHHVTGLFSRGFGFEQLRMLVQESVAASKLEPVGPVVLLLDE
jgi:hypothetical protein